MRTSPRRPRPRPFSAAGQRDLAADPVNRIVERLRDEWLDGCPATQRISLVMAELGGLRRYAATNEAARLITDLEDRLRAYKALPVADRKATLTGIGTDVKKLSPLLTPPEAPVAPVGTLDSTLRVPKPAKTSVKEKLAKPVSPMQLTDNVTRLPSVGSSVATKLASLGLTTVGDVLRFAPRRHIDFSRPTAIGSALASAMNEEITIQGEVLSVDIVYAAKPKRTQIKLTDGSGTLKVTWFSEYIGNQLRPGDRLALNGKLDTQYGLGMTGPEWLLLDTPDRAISHPIMPVYSLTAGVTQKTLRKLTRSALDATTATIIDVVPAPVLKDGGAPLLALPAAFAQLHYPDDYPGLEAARTRLAFDDLLLIQLGLLQRKHTQQGQQSVALPPDAELIDAFHAGLPFQLTAAQRKVIAEVGADLAKPVTMRRLLQGDVGSGKTVVAATALLQAHANNLQGALMAPTEILAEQHASNLDDLFSRLPVEQRPTLALLTGSTRVAARRDILARCANGKISILIGTHALIQDTVEFARLGLSVVDEQHRFGVKQRGALASPAREDRLAPHQLSMTATPIPRSLNMVLFGDLDVSVIDERPPGRIPIETRRYVGFDREEAYVLVRQEIHAGRQTFVICPLVEASEKSEAKAAVDEAQRLQAEVFPDLRIATLHGRMSGKDKDAVMTAFRAREFDILVATSVIEVGIDIPNATVMMIEGADRFGLAQLHQFRGRVGRGGNKSYCLLLADDAAGDAEARLAMMVATDDGFKLAEKDLELRGPGDFIGTRQSGLPELSWLAAGFDSRLLDRARLAAERLLAADPDLSQPTHRPLADRLATFWAAAAPDISG